MCVLRGAPVLTTSLQYFGIRKTQTSETLRDQTTLVNIRMPKNGDLPFWIYLEDDDQSMITGWEFGGLEMIKAGVFLVSRHRL